MDLIQFKKYRISTKMEASPRPQGPFTPHNFIKVDRGATADLSFTFFDKVYTYQQLKQLTFMFKYDVDKLSYFKFFDEQGNPDPGSPEDGYALSYDEDADTIYLELKPNFTINFPVERPVEYEIAVELKDDDDVIIERQPALWPVATLYGELNSSEPPVPPNTEER